MTSIGRSSAIIAAGTLMSRLTGLVRTIMLVAVLGAYASEAADAFYVANELPNSIYALVSAGLLTAIVVPQIVRATKHADGGSAFVSKLYTLGITALMAVTLAATLAAPWLVGLYAGDSYSPEQFALATALAYWCIPQVLFYSLYALIGETLNARGVFGPYAWAPIVNNLVSIAGFGAMLWFWGSDLTAVSDWTPDRVTLLGALATGGIVLQAAALMLFWRRIGLRIRPDFRWRGMGLGHLRSLAGWTFLMVVTATVAGIVQTRILNAASGSAASVAVFTNGWLVFMVPYSVIIMSIGTTYFTRIAEFAASERILEMRESIARAIRTLAVLVIPAAAAMIVAAVPATRVFTSSASDALSSAPLLVAFTLWLPPGAVLFIVQRSFYALGDTRTPFLFTLLQGILVVLTALIAGWLLPLEHLAAGIALGQSFAGTVQAIVAVVLLQRRIGSLFVASWFGAMARFTIAAVPAALAGWLVYLLSGAGEGWMAADRFGAIGGLLLIAAVGGAIYLGMLAVLRTPELRELVGALRGRFGR